jgi:hypothetical protein
MFGMDAMPGRAVVSVNDAFNSNPNQQSVRSITTDPDLPDVVVPNVRVLTSGAAVETGKLILAGRRVYMFGGNGFGILSFSSFETSMTYNTASKISSCNGLAVVPGYVLCSELTGSTSLLALRSRAIATDFPVRGRALTNNVPAMSDILVEGNILFGRTSNNKVVAVELTRPDGFIPAASAAPITQLRSVVVDNNIIYASTGAEVAVRGDERLLIFDAADLDDIDLLNASGTTVIGSPFNDGGELMLSGRSLVTAKRSVSIDATPGGGTSLITIDPTLPGQPVLTATDRPDVSPTPTTISFTVHGSVAYLFASDNDLEGWVIPGGPSKPGVRLRQRSLGAGTVGRRTPVIDGKFLYFVSDGAVGATGNSTVRRIEIDDPNAIDVAVSAPLTLGPTTVPQFANSAGTGSTASMNRSITGQLVVANGLLWIPGLHQQNSAPGFSVVSTSTFSGLVRHDRPLGSLVVSGDTVIAGAGRLQNGQQGSVAGVFTVLATDAPTAADDVDADGVVENAEYPVLLETTAVRAPQSMAVRGAVLVTANENTGIRLVRLSR